MPQNTKEMKKRRPIFALSFMVLLCVSLLCGNASAAALVVIDLADTVDEMAPSVVEVFTETKQVGHFFQEYVTKGAGSGVISGSDIEGLAFAIPANTVQAITQELIQHGYVTGRPQLGITAVSVKLTEQKPE